MLGWARRHPVAAAGLFFLLLLFLEFPGVLLLRQVPFVSEMVAGSDLMDFNYPVRRILSQGLRQGSVPLWTDAVNTGFPIHGEGQGGFLYPPNLLLGLLPLAASINLSLVLTYLGAGILMFLYARELGRSRTAALFAGMVFAFSGFLFGHIRHLNLIAAAQWLPLLLLLCERYARTRRPIYLLALAPVQALQHLAGHPQTTYYSLLFTGAYLVVRVLAGEGSGLRFQGPGPGLTSPVHPFTRSSLHPPGRRLRWAAVAALGFAAAAGLGAGLAAVQVLPTWELAQLAHRSAKGSIHEATYYTLPLQHLVTLVWPFFFGDPGRNTYRFFEGEHAVLFWENCGYVGLIPLGLALYAAVTLWRRDRRVAILAGAAVVSLLLAMGKQTPLFPFLWSHLPGMGEFRIAARFLLVTDLALAALAGWGFDLLRTRLTVARPRLAPAVVWLLIAVSAAELLYYGSRQYALVDARKWLSPAPVMAAIGADRDRYRVYTWHEPLPWLETLDHFGGWQRDPEVLYPLRNTLLPNSGVLQGMPHYSVYSGFFFTDKGVLDGQINRLLAGKSPNAVRLGLRLLGLYNVGYIAAPDDLSPGGARLAETFDVPGSPAHSIRLWRNPYALPRAYVVPRAGRVDGIRGFLERFAGPGHDPRQTVLLDAKDAAGAAVDESPGREAVGKPGTVRWLQCDPERIALEVDAPGGGWLVLSDYSYPGWSARVDGELVAAYRANVTVRAVRVPPGRHEVVFAYEPLSWEQGILLTSLSLTLLLGLSGLCLRAGCAKVTDTGSIVGAATPGGRET